MSARKRHLLVLAPLAVAALALPGGAGALTTTGSVEALNEPGGGLYNEERHFWSPERVNLAGSGTVTFSNKSASIPHGVYWTSATHPACEEGAGKVPVGLAKSAVNWSGACSFAKSGAYTYYCTVHGPAMSGAIDVLGTPEAATEAAGEATQTNATLHGSVKPEGNATEYRFEYGTGLVNEHSTPTLALTAEDFTGHAVSAVLSGLTPATTYHVRLVLVYGEAHTVLDGSERELKTLATLAPAVKVSLPSPLTETAATLKGTVDPEGETTKYFFEYGPSEGELVPLVPVTLPADGAMHSVSASVSGLLAGHEYDYRLFAENGRGQSEVTGTFTTTSPPPPSLPPPPSPIPTPLPPSPEPMVPLIAPPTLEKTASFGPSLIPASLKLSGHGSVVRGSIGIGLPGAGGRLEVELLAKPAVFGARGSKPVVVGRFVRASASAGTLSFSVSLSAKAKAVLRRHGRLALSAKVTLKPSGGILARLMRTLTLRA
jgi:plastocyanin